MLATVNTFIATAAAIVSWSLVETFTRGKASMLGGASGMVAGLVAVTPAAGIVGPMGAIVHRPRSSRRFATSSSPW
jgi:Amt family ammonium transporter